MSKHLPRVAGGFLLLSLLTASLSLAQGDIQRRTTSVSDGSPAAMSTALMTETNPGVAPAQDVSWYVIVGSFPKNQRRQADARASYVRSRGYKMQVYSSSEFVTLTPGLWVVMDGPYTRRQAQQVLNNVRSVAGDAYIKRAVYPD